MEKVIQLYFRELGREFLRDYSELDAYYIGEDLEGLIQEYLEETQKIFKRASGTGAQKMAEAIQYYLMDGLFYWLYGENWEENGLQGIINFRDNK